ncbi:MAG: thioredoxin family protein [Thermoanaerobaculia bacterium]|nr:thioredoxin family protein [Thermoanaerobaculia bacterium]
MGAAEPEVEPPVWHQDPTEALRLAEASERAVLVDLYAEWCHWCERLEEEVFSQAVFREDLAEDYVFLRVDAEEEHGLDLRRRFRIQSLPTTLLMTPDRIEIGRVEGYAPLGPFLDRIETREREYESLLDRYRREIDSRNPQTLTSLARDLYDRGAGIRAAEAWERLLEAPEPAPAERARLAYEIAESRRRGGDLEGAEQAFARARKELRAAGLEGSELGARLALLRYHLQHDRGDCPEAVSSLERFLESYPESSLAEPARSTLRSLRESESCA